MTPRPWTTLVDADGLAAAIAEDAANLVVLDARFSLADTAAGEQAWQASHVPGARYIHLDRDLSDHRRRGQGRHPWPRAEDVVARLGALGIGADTQVVVYDDGDGSIAARAWWLLTVLGHPAVAVLDGGWRGWCAAGHPVTAERPVVQAVVYPQRHFDDTRLLDAGQVIDHLALGGPLLDARAAARFRGEVEPLDPVAGHVPGARNRPFADNLAVDGLHFKPAPRLAAEFGEVLGGSAPNALVTMCGSGVTACHHLLALAHAGLGRARLYTGSWSGWISDPSRPVARGA
jgi:thiosulfate/3-mercaptopyruvate sulfurtransferase